MKWLNNLFVLALLPFAAEAQLSEYNFHRKLDKVTEQWHSVILPDDVYTASEANLKDIRIYNVTARDTIETPFILRLNEEKVLSSEVAFRTINTSHNERGYYYTFELPVAESINLIELHFSKDNFDWRTNLEGSHNKSDWFTLLGDYRILAIRNQSTEFRFTKLIFPQSDYKYYRLNINSVQNPGFTEAKLSREFVENGLKRNYPVRIEKNNVNPELKQSEIYFSLPAPLPVSSIEVKAGESFDYYRNIRIEYLADSFRTEKGWQYSYVVLSEGVLNSLEKNVFKCDNIITQKLRLIIRNEDNIPLTIDSIKAGGFVYDLVARFAGKGDYFLVYGYRNATAPHYDLERFSNKIPEELKQLQTGEVSRISKAEVTGIEPLFKNKAWLWAIMILIIAVLGWFSIKMMKKKE